jgi:hypothetical protein
MDSVTVDEKLAGSLTAGGTLVEVKDPTGKVIGFFAPVTMEYAEKYAQAAGQFYPVKDLPKSNGRTYTTAEVLEHLRSLEQK